MVNADSMQLYRGMDIGTAKLAPAERGGIERNSGAAVGLQPLAHAEAALARHQRLGRGLRIEQHRNAAAPPDRRGGRVRGRAAPSGRHG